MSDGRDFDGLTDPSAGELPSRRNLPNTMDSESVSDGPQDPGQLCSSAKSDQVINSRGSLSGPVLSMSAPNCAPTARGPSSQ